MEFPVVIGSAGVLVLLLAFFLNVSRILNPEDKLWLFMNLLGGLLSSYASLLINFMPFAILEGTWALVALVSLAKILSK